MSIMNDKAYMLNPQQFEQVQRKYVNELLAAKLVDFALLDSWWQAAQGAIRFQSPVSIGLGGVDWKRLREKLSYKETLTYYEYGLMSTVIETCTPAQLEHELCSITYDDLMIMIQNLAVAFNEYNASIQEKATELTIKEINPREIQRDEFKNMRSIPE